MCCFLATSLIFSQEIKNLEPKSISELKQQRTKASVVVESNVPSVKIYLNSVYQGSTKLTIDELLPGEYILTAAKDGYKEEQYYVTAKKGYILSYRVELKKAEQSSEQISE